MFAKLSIILGLGISANAFAGEWQFAEPHTCQFSQVNSDQQRLTASVELIPKQTSFDVKIAIFLEGQVITEKLFSHVDTVWDGHDSGLITAPGLSLFYLNWYGVIHEPVLIAQSRFGASNSGNFLTWRQGQCVGSSGPVP